MKKYIATTAFAAVFFCVSMTQAQQTNLATVSLEDISRMCILDSLACRAPDEVHQVFDTGGNQLLLVTSYSDDSLGIVLFSYGLSEFPISCQKAVFFKNKDDSRWYLSTYKGEGPLYCFIEKTILLLQKS